MSRFRIDRCLFVTVVPAFFIASAPAAAPARAVQAEAKAAAVDGPLGPALAAATFQLEPGLRIELVAAEPLVVSPVACAFDARGRLFVAENRGYPTGPGEGEPPVGRIALLEDTDHDGRMDRRTEFATGLTFPNGVMPFKDGVIVTCAPDVLWLRDRDGDGKSDERQVMFTGFSTTGSTQLRVSHPTLAPDNWVYLTSGLTGGSVRAPDRPKSPVVTLGRTDFRFRLDRHAYEAADGGSQYGLSFDDFGRRFICYNRVQMQHVVIDSSILRRNPHLAFSETVQDCPAERMPEPLKGHGAAARLFPISRNVTTADSHAGTFTAACAVTVWRGDQLPDAYRGGVFSCDPTGNLVHFDRLEPAGATFSARPLQLGREFLASTDNWFRPVFLAHGPDGALYVCDMYRKTIEHPDYLPEEVRRRTDFEGGKTLGRIWRVVRAAARAADLAERRQVALADADTPQLRAALLDLDGWHRDTAQRRLLERGDASARGPLAAIAADAASPPASVACALGLLEALGGLTDDLIRHSLKHPCAGVRERALRLAQDHPARLGSWRTEVPRMADDPDPRVRFQAAIALGSAAMTDGDAAPVVAALARIAARDGQDRWLRAAVFSSLAGRERKFLGALRAQAGAGADLVPELLTELGRLLARAVPRTAWPDVIRQVVDGEAKPTFTPADQAALVTGLAEAARGQLGPERRGNLLSALVAGEPALSARLNTLADAMAAVALDPATGLDRRREAVGLLALTSFQQRGATLLTLVEGSQPVALQTAAVRALGAQDDPRVVGELLAPERFRGYSPAVRDEILAALLARPAHVPEVLQAVADGRLPSSAVDALRRRQFAEHPDPAIQRRAEALFGSVTGDRAKVYDSYKSVLALKPNPSNGRGVFRRDCAQCHRLDQEGSAVGPDLFGIRNQPKEAILLHILVPDHEITPGFAAYSVSTRDGRVLTGLIASESPTMLTIRQPLGKEDTIPRDEVEELAASKQSLMPQGLENSISRQEFADLLAFLKGEAAGSR